MRKVIKFMWIYIIPNFIKNITKYCYIKFNYKLVNIEWSTINNLKIDNIIELFSFGDYSSIGENINILGKFHIGKYSYIGRGSFINGNDTFGTLIGNYCSIAENLYIVSVNNHYPELLTTNDKILRVIGKDTKVTGGDVSIGNDVWIGSNVTILDGISIGNGAIVGANTIVTKDVPDYAIVVGNPGKILKYRFNKEQIDYLLKSKWWDLDEKDIYLFYKKFNKKYDIKDNLLLK